MKRKVFMSVLVLALVAMIFIFSGCGTITSPSDTGYWFSKSENKYIPFDADKYNLDEAGSYWYFTAAKDVNVTMKVKINIDDFDSCLYLYVNNEQVKSETDLGIFSRVYNLSLKKGDEIKLHAFWVNGIAAENGSAFEIYMLTMSEDGKDYVLTEFDKSTTR